MADYHNLHFALVVGKDNLENLAHQKAVHMVEEEAVKGHRSHSCSDAGVDQNSSLAGAEAVVAHIPLASHIEEGHFGLHADACWLPPILFAVFFPILFAVFFLILLPVSVLPSEPSFPSVF